MIKDVMSDASYNVLLLHIVRDERVFSEFCLKTYKRTFDKVIRAPHDFVAEVAARLHDEHGRHPGMAAFKMKFYEMLMNSTYDGELRDNFSDFFEALCEVPPEDLHQEAGLALLGKVIDAQVAEEARARLLRVLESGGSTVEAMADITEDMSRRSLDAGGDAELCDPLFQFEKLLVRSEYHPTGLDFFDVAMGGGMRKRDVVTLIAPSGGGKTTMGLQLAVSWLKQSYDRHVVFCSYEQPAEGDMMERLATLTTHLPVSTFRGKAFLELDEATRARVEASVADIKARFHFADYSRGQAGLRGVADMSRALREFKVLGTGCPVLVIVDWFLPFVQRSMLGAGLDVSNEGALRTHGSHLMDQLKIFKNKENITMFITHQLNLEASAASPSRKPNWTEAAFWRGFSWFADVAFALGRMSDDGVAWLVADKTRAFAKNSRFIKLRGEHCEFVDVNSEYMISSSGRVMPKDGNFESVAEPDARMAHGAAMAASFV
jgi:RecA/RadA recombinase